MSWCGNEVCYCTGDCMTYPSPWDYPWSPPDPWYPVPTVPDNVPSTWTISSVWESEEKKYAVVYRVPGEPDEYMETRGEGFIWTSDLEEATLFSESDAYKRIIDVWNISPMWARDLEVVEVVEKTKTVRRLVE